MSRIAVGHHGHARDAATSEAGHRGEVAGWRLRRRRRRALGPQLGRTAAGETLGRPVARDGVPHAGKHGTSDDDLHGLLFCRCQRICVCTTATGRLDGPRQTRSKEFASVQPPPDGWMDHVDGSKTPVRAGRRIQLSSYMKNATPDGHERFTDRVPRLCVPQHRDTHRDQRPRSTNTAKERPADR